METDVMIFFGRGTYIWSLSSSGVDKTDASEKVKSGEVFLECQDPPRRDLRLYLDL